MTTIAYQPPKRMFADTLMAFKDFEMASAWSARIDPDPLGPVNRIVSIWHGKRRVKAGLAHVPVGANVELIHEPGGSYTIGDLHAMAGRMWDRRGYLSTDGIPDPLPPRRAPGWYVTVDGRTVLYASDAEIWPAPKPIPVGALKSAQDRAQAAKRWLLAQPRAATDRLARRLGYHREDECTGWDE